MALPAALLDVDGTLVDTNYQHAIAWYRAFRTHEIVLPVWRIHRHIGMGGDQLVAALCGEDVEERLGDDVRKSEGALYMDLIEEVEPLSHARGLIEELKRRGHSVVLASSAKGREVDYYLDLLDAGARRRLDDRRRRRAHEAASRPRRGRRVCSSRSAS
jgi:beta-phosphoglucomutase-like phosphatase (HAD superfamily)